MYLRCSIHVRSATRRRCYSISVPCFQQVPLIELTGQSVGYVTDVEGNLGHWNRWIDLSTIVSRNETTCELDLHDKCQLVYGGDVWDRGKGDLRIIRDLVNLKKRYPSRVHLVFGNRDINKLRLLSELEENVVQRDMQTYWTGRVKRSPNQEDGMPGRLRLILEKTMGCPHSFEFRRQELKELGVITPEDSVEEQGQKIASSYLDAVRKGGLLAEYLRLGSLALLLGDCLFVHGGFHASTLGWVPPPTAVGDRAESVQQWVQQLQSFHDREVEDLYSDFHSRRTDFSSKWAHLYKNEEFLEKPFTLSSEIIRGFRRGTALGFPTANLDIPSLTVTSLTYDGGKGSLELSEETDDSSLMLEDIQTGVYVGCARIYSSASDTSESSFPQYYPCVFSVGWNPTYDNTSKTIEAHLLDIDISSTLPHKEPLPSDFSGERIDIHTLVYLRDEVKFDNIDALVSGIREDVARTKGYMCLLQLFLNDKDLIKGKVIEDVDSNIYSDNATEFDPSNTEELCQTSSFVPYAQQPWSAMGGYCSHDIGSGLLQYGMGGLRGRVKNPTVVYENFLHDGAPQVPDQVVLKYLRHSGISKVFTGHQPHGDSPVVMTADEKEASVIQFFTCDTSYAKDVQWSTQFFESSQECLRKVLEASAEVNEVAPDSDCIDSEAFDTRGLAVAEVCLHFRESTLDNMNNTSTVSSPPSCDVSIQGRLNNAVRYSFKLDDGYVGRKFDVDDTATTWWVKAYIDVCSSNGDKERVFVICKSEGINVCNSLISEEELSNFL